MGQYTKRFKKITNLINHGDKKIIELCFADTYIANYCKKNDIKWIGYDINYRFVENANKRKFESYQIDLLKENITEKADMCLIIGSLYHFNNSLEFFFLKMLNISHKIIISEPVKNLTNSNRFLSFFSKKISDAGNGTENFRFNKNSFYDAIEKMSVKLNFSYKSIYEGRDIIIEIHKSYEGN